MRSLLYGAVDLLARIHDWISSLNDSVEHSFSDKELHFLVIGLMGLLLIFIIYPLFRRLARKNHVMVISWIYVFTLILVITFAIEIGQRLTGTGSMEFADIVFGIGGFVFLFAVFALLRAIVSTIADLIRIRKNTRKENPPCGNSSDA